MYKNIGQLKTGLYCFEDRFSSNIPLDKII